MIVLSLRFDISGTLSGIQCFFDPLNPGCDPDPIRDPEKTSRINSVLRIHFGSGIQDEKIRIRDTHPESSTLLAQYICLSRIKILILSLAHVILPSQKRSLFKVQCAQSSVKFEKE